MNDVRNLTDYAIKSPAKVILVADRALSGKQFLE
jgi:hypothetical protein